MDFLLWGIFLHAPSSIIKERTTVLLNIILLTWVCNTRGNLLLCCQKSTTHMLPGKSKDPVSQVLLSKPVEWLLHYWFWFEPKGGCINAGNTNGYLLSVFEVNYEDRFFFSKQLKNNLKEYKVLRFFENDLWKENIFLLYLTTQLHFAFYMIKNNFPKS